MFTGLIQSLATVVENKSLKSHARLVLEFPRQFKKAQRGESIAINGCCLTVTQIQKNKLSFDVSDETLLKTNLGQLKKGQKVNVERALKVGQALGGHFVMGHVDGLAKVLKVKPEAGSLKIDFSLSKQLIRFVIDKGSIALDGISLTVSQQPKGILRVFRLCHTGAGRYDKSQKHFLPG